MSYIARWLTGLVFAVVSVKESMTDDPCFDFLIRGTETYGVNCSNRNVTEIPTIYAFRHAHIVFLDISHCDNIVLKDSDMQNYEKLQQLLMKGLHSTSNFSKKFFDPLKSLELLDMSGMQLQDDSGTVGQILPASLVTCIVNDCNITIFDLSHLDNLVQLEITNNDLDNIPLISNEAPLDVLDLRMNPLNNLKYTDLAPFCLLSTIYIIPTRNSQLHHDSKYSQCCRLEKWIKQFDINGTKSLNCTTTAADKTCWFANETEYNIAKNERLTCLVKNGRIAEPTEILFYIANGLVLFILFLGISYLIFKYFTKVYRPKRRLRKRNVDSYAGPVK